jgi:hypothetical protein
MQDNCSAFLLNWQTGSAGGGSRCAQEQTAQPFALGSVGHILFCMKHWALHISSLSSCQQPWDMTREQERLTLSDPDIRYQDIGAIYKSTVFTLSPSVPHYSLISSSVLSLSPLSLPSNPPSLFFCFFVSFIFYSSSSESLPSLLVILRPLLSLCFLLSLFASHSSDPLLSS